MPTFYEILNIPEHATLMDIHIACRGMLRKHHPSKHNNSELSINTYKKIKYIYFVLRHPLHRAIYDQELAQKRINERINRQFSLPSKYMAPPSERFYELNSSIQKPAFETVATTQQYTGPEFPNYDFGDKMEGKDQTPFSRYFFIGLFVLFFLIDLAKSSNTEARSPYFSTVPSISSTGSLPQIGHLPQARNDSFLFVKP